MIELLYFGRVLVYKTQGSSFILFTPRKVIVFVAFFTKVSYSNYGSDIFLIFHCSLFQSKTKKREIL